VAVGYDYLGNWKIRNSWGDGWGESGHIWLAPGNTCAVMTRVDGAI
jgi:C1A family cysteine protease